jgi:hypothetical protein
VKNKFKKNIKTVISLMLCLYGISLFSIVCFADSRVSTDDINEKFYQISKMANKDSFNRLKVLNEQINLLLNKSDLEYIESILNDLNAYTKYHSYDNLYKVLDKIRNEKNVNKYSDELVNYYGSFLDETINSYNSINSPTTKILGVVVIFIFLVTLFMIIYLVRNY